MRPFGVLRNSTRTAAHYTVRSKMPAVGMEVVGGGVLLGREEAPLALAQHHHKRYQSGKARSDKLSAAGVKFPCHGGELCSTCTGLDTGSR